MPGISIPLRPRHQHEETSPTYAYTDRHGLLTSPSSTDSNVDQRVQTLAQTTQLLSMVVQHNHVLLNRAAGNLTNDMDTLEETFNELASGAIRSLSAPPISCLQKLAIAKANLMSVIEELSAMADTVEATKRHVTAELDMIHLRALAAEWFTVG